MKRILLSTAFILLGFVLLKAQVLDSTNYYIFKDVRNKTAPGNPALQMNYTTVNGTQITMDDLKGKVVLLDFWASYCAYCVSQIPELTTLQKKYPEIAVVRISVDERQNAWLSATNRYNIDGYNLWANGMSSPAWDYTLDLFYFDANPANNMPASFELSNPIPVYVLIDEHGKIVSNMAPEPGTEELDRLIRELLN